MNYEITFERATPRRRTDTPDMRLWRIVVNGVPRECFTDDPQGFLAGTSYSYDDTVLEETLKTVK